MLIASIVVLVIALSSQQLQIGSENLPSTSLLNSGQSEEAAGNSQFATANDDADRIGSLEPVEDGINLDDLDLVPGVIFKAILHPPFGEQPAVLRL